jgi:hypothetical protein
VIAASRTAAGAAVLLTALLSAPGAVAQPKPLQRSSAAKFTPSEDPGYRVGAGDLLTFRRAGAAETVSAAIGVDGSVRLPGSGAVRIDGLTIAEISDALLEELGPDFADCRVAVQDCRSQVLHVFGMDAGEGSRPVPYRGRETVQQLLDRIDCRRCQRGYRVRVVRPGDSLNQEPKIFAVQLNDRLTSRNPEEPPVHLKAGDYVYIERDVGKPGFLTSITAGRLYLQRRLR